MSKKLIFIDCDSTLSAVEGIDELAGLRGKEVLKQCSEMTSKAMDGEIKLEEVYGARLDLIRPNAAECAKVAQMYIDTIEPTAVAFIAGLREQGWEPIIVSGGLTQVIRPFADHLGIAKLRAVDLFFDGQGNYAGFDKNCPTSRMGGKMEVIEAELDGDAAASTVMVGDGSSDLETHTHVDLFIGYGGFVEREKVKAEARAFVYKLVDILDLLKGF